MVDHPIKQDLSTKIADDLMNSNNNAATTVRVELDRIDMRIDHPPLSSPVVANAAMPMDRSTFHAVGPLHIGLHSRERGFHFTGVECPIRLANQVARRLINRQLQRGHGLRLNQKLAVLHDLLVVDPDVELPSHNVDVGR